MYRGDLLEGLGHECFAAERERLSDRYEDALAIVAERRLATGDPVGARDAADRLLERDPLREEAHAVLIAVHGLIGIPVAGDPPVPAPRRRPRSRTRASDRCRTPRRSTASRSTGRCAGRSSAPRSSMGTERRSSVPSRTDRPGQPSLSTSSRTAAADASKAACSSAVSSISKIRSMPPSAEHDRHADEQPVDPVLALE